jgi:hypothetical protein
MDGTQRHRQVNDGLSDMSHGLTSTYIADKPADMGFDMATLENAKLRRKACFAAPSSRPSSGTCVVSRATGLLSNKTYLTWRQHKNMRLVTVG